VRAASGTAAAVFPAAIAGCLLLLQAPAAIERHHIARSSYTMCSDVHVICVSFECVVTADFECS
jgi:hypothetical protein